MCIGRNWAMTTSVGLQLFLVEGELCKLKGGNRVAHLPMRRWGYPCWLMKPFDLGCSLCSVELSLLKHFCALLLLIWIACCDFSLLLLFLRAKIIDGYFLKSSSIWYSTSLLWWADNLPSSCRWTPHFVGNLECSQVLIRRNWGWFLMLLCNGSMWADSQGKRSLIQGTVTPKWFLFHIPRSDLSYLPQPSNTTAVEQCVPSCSFVVVRALDTTSCLCNYLLCNAVCGVPSQPAIIWLLKTSSKAP